MWSYEDVSAPLLVLFIGTTVGTRHQMFVNVSTGVLGDAVLK
jgi:hypothetical protein